MWSVPPLLKDFTKIFAGFGNLELGWEKSDHRDDTWRYSMGHKRKGTRSQDVAWNREYREQTRKELFCQNSQK